MRSVIVLSLFLLGTCDLCFSASSEESYPQVTTSLGTIEGYYKTSYGGRQFEAYEGIPYAQAPTGDLRFEVAQSISSWSDVLLAKTPGSMCMQYNFVQRNETNRVVGLEDCLYLNIYTPTADDRKANDTSAELLPVVFFIAGGAFLVGTGNQYGPKYLLDRNVTVVTFNYRLGVLGFLSTEDKVVSGNMGLKDQVIALQWVHDHIESFGGDPTRIAIVGQSAGGASVHYHYLTNLTTGLFHSGLSMSGTALNPWALIENPLENTKAIAAHLDCPTNDTQAIVDCLKSLSAHDVVAAMGNFAEIAFHPPNRWGPSIEKGGAEFTFIDRHPIDIINSGDIQEVPWISGIVSAEALFPMSLYLANEDLFDVWNEKWETLASYVLNYEDTITESNKSTIAKAIKEHYLGDSDFGRATFKKTVEMVGDRLFGYPSEAAARAHSAASSSSVFTFYITYRGAHSVSESLSRETTNYGVCHGDDLRYVVDATMDPTTTESDLKIQQILIDLWVSIANNSIPDVGVSWDKLKVTQADNFYYLNVAGPEELYMESATDFKNKTFWHSIDFDESIE